MAPPGGMMDGFSLHDRPERRPQAKPPAAAAAPFPDGQVVPVGWAKGQTTRMEPVRCCPECGATDVARRDNAIAEQIERWDCKVCWHSFRMQVQPRQRCWGFG